MKGEGGEYGKFGWHIKNPGRTFSIIGIIQETLLLHRFISRFHLTLILFIRDHW